MNLHQIMPASQQIKHVSGGAQKRLSALRVWCEKEPVYSCISTHCCQNLGALTRRWRRSECWCRWPEARWAARPSSGRWAGLRRSRRAWSWTSRPGGWSGTPGGRLSRTGHGDGLLARQGVSQFVVVEGTQFYPDWVKAVAIIAVIVKDSYFLFCLSLSDFNLIIF